MKKEILRNKRKLKGKEVWIRENLTWEKRRIRWKIRQIALREKIQGNKIREGH